MFFNTNIISSASLTKTISLSGMFFNSESHFYECLHKELGLAINTLKKEIKPLFREGHFFFKKFKDGIKGNMHSSLQFLYSEEQSLRYEKQAIIPEYILSTRKISDGTLKLGEREYRILCYLNELKTQINYYNEENSTNSPLYPCMRTVAKAINSSISQAPYSMHKIEYYFPDFWVYEDNFENRVHPESCSLTINLPPRKDWRSLIEAKVIETTGLTDLYKPKTMYVTPEIYEDLKKKWENGYEKSLKYYIEVDYSEEESKEFMETEEEILEGEDEIKRSIQEMYKEVGRITDDLINKGEMTLVTQARELKPFKVYEATEEVLLKVKNNWKNFIDMYKIPLQTNLSTVDSSKETLWLFQKRIKNLQFYFEKKCHCLDLLMIDSSIDAYKKEILENLNIKNTTQLVNRITELEKHKEEILVKVKRQEIKKRGVLTLIKEIYQATQIKIDLEDSPVVNEGKVTEILQAIHYRDGVYENIEKHLLLLSYKKTIVK